MSHSGSTQYYDLPQFIGSDVINPLTDTNGAYSAIDTALHAVAVNSADASQTADEAKETADALEGRVTNNETAIENVQHEEANIVSSMASPFNPSKLGGYKVGEFVTYEGNLYQFTVDHMGAWSGADVNETTVGEMIENILGVLAEPFSATYPGGYAVGDYCIHDDKLYRFVHDHTSGWNASDVEEVTVTGELKRLASVVGKHVMSAPVKESTSSLKITLACKAMLERVKTLWLNKASNVADIVIEKFDDVPVDLSVLYDLDSFGSATVDLMGFLIFPVGVSANDGDLNVTNLEIKVTSGTITCELLSVDLQIHSGSASGSSSDTDTSDAQVHTFRYHYVYDV